MAVGEGKREGTGWPASLGGEIEEIAKAVPSAYWQGPLPGLLKHYARRWLTGGDFAQLEARREGNSSGECLRKSLRHRLGGGAKVRQEVLPKSRAREVQGIDTPSARAIHPDQARTLGADCLVMIPVF